MTPLLIIIPSLIVFITLGYLIGHSIGRVWLNHRVKIALLEKLENKPELLKSFQELQQLLDGAASDPDAENRQDLSLTGIILAVIGVACVVLYTTIASGRWAVGAYWGGVACVAIGFLLSLLGLLIRFLSRSLRL